MPKKIPPRKLRNYAATEATLINVRALKKDVQQLKARVALLEGGHGRMEPPPVPPPEAPDEPLEAEPET